MTQPYIEPLNLKYILVNVFAGSQVIFTAMFILFLSIAAGLFKIPSKIFLALLALSSIILASYFGVGFYLLTIILVSWFVYYSMSKLVK